MCTSTANQPVLILALQTLYPKTHLPGALPPFFNYFYTELKATQNREDSSTNLLKDHPVSVS